MSIGAATIMIDPPARNDTAAKVIVARVQWNSATNRNYSVWRATTLMKGAAGFQRIAEGLPGTPPHNVFTDVTATGPGPYYYRIQTTQ